MSKEIELKVLISREDLRKLLNADFMKKAILPGSKAKHHLVSSYYDTEDLFFNKNGIVYRVRDKGDGSFEATVKTGKKISGGITERIEMDLPLEKDEAILEGFADLGLGFELTELAPDGVIKLFTVDVERTTYDLEFLGSSFELAVDRGKIISDMTKSKEKIDEMEIEIKEGSVQDLLQLAALIAKAVPIFIESRSKFARGLALIGENITYQVEKNKLGFGPVREELMNGFTARGNVALSSQTLVIKNNFATADVKELVKQMQYMLSYMLLAAELDSEGIFDEHIDLSKEILHLTKRVLDLRSMLELWRTVDLQGKFFTKTNMSIVLQENISKAEAVLLEELRWGKLTEVFFGVQAGLASSSWDNEIYMEAASVARGVIKKWQEELVLADNPEEELMVSDKIMFLARAIDAKFAEKIVAALKKKRNVLAAKALDKRMEQELIRMLQATNSKYIYRDAGVLFGMLNGKRK